MPSSGALKLREINSLRLSRDSIQKWLPETKFPDIIKNLYTRVVVRDKESNKVYKIAKVTAIKDIRTDEKSAIITVAVGRQSKDFSLDFVSNGSFTEDELLQYKQTMESEGLRLVTPSEITAKIKEIKVFVNSCKGASKSNAQSREGVSQSKRRMTDTDGPDYKRAAVDRSVAVSHGPPDARMKRLETDNRLLRSKLQDTEVRLLKTSEKHDKLSHTYQQLREEHAEGNKLLTALQNQVKGLGDQQAAVKRKERQIEDMRWELERLQTEVGNEREKCEQQQRAVKAEQEAVRLRLLKIKEMDMVIKVQEENVQSLQEIADIHQSLSKAQGQHIQQVQAKNKKLKEEVKRLRGGQEKKDGDKDGDDKAGAEESAKDT